MKKIMMKDIRDIVVTLGVIVLVRFIFCYFNNTEVFTDEFGLLIIIFVLSSIIFRFIRKSNK